MDSDPLHEVSTILADAGIRYAVIGGHAVNTWLEPRFTADIDYTVSAEVAEMQSVREVLERAGFRVEREHGAGQPSGPDFLRLVSGDASVVVEIQFAKTELQSDVVSRAQSDPLGARIATVEDLIVMKLIANRGKDIIDLDGLAALPGIDWSYVERWCREWEIVDRLDRLRDSIGRR